jgi:hypothetical protein
VSIGRSSIRHSGGASGALFGPLLHDQHGGFETTSPARPRN